VAVWSTCGRRAPTTARSCCRLHGAHQGANAACALAAVEAFFAAPLSEEVVEAGFARVRVPGRLEVVGRQPLVLVDGAHNAAGMAVLAAAITEDFAVEGPTVVVVGMLSGRDPSALLAALAPIKPETVIVCAPESPRAIGPDALAEAARRLGLDAVVADSVADAISRGRAAVPRAGSCS